MAEWRLQSQLRGSCATRSAVASPRGSSAEVGIADCVAESADDNAEESAGDEADIFIRN